MQRTELIIGGCLIAIGIVPVASILIYGMPEPEPLNCAHRLPMGCETLEKTVLQFALFWHLISFFLIGIGVWFVAAGLTSRAIVSQRHSK